MNYVYAKMKWVNDDGREVRRKQLIRSHKKKKKEGRKEVITNESRND